MPVSSDWSVIVRKDGTSQWVYKGKALYSFVNDIAPGDANGEGDGGWHAVTLEPAPPNPSWVTIQESDAGSLLADPEGKTLYAHAAEIRRAVGRYSGPPNGIERPEDWKPVLAAAEAQPIGEWSLLNPILPAPPGAKQWAYRGLLLYTNVRDSRPGETQGVRSMDRVWMPIMTNGLSMPGAGN
jgi:predicted lipoprotein with Yx(FWY)xxD motif